MRDQLFLPITLVLLTALGWAPAVMAGECEGSLGYLQDKSATSTSGTQYASFENFFCSQEYSSYGEARDAGIKVGVPIENVPAEVNGHNKSSNWGEYQKSVCNEIRTNNFSSSELRESVIKGNRDAIQAWSACVRSPGFHFWAEQNTPDASTFVLLAKFIPYNRHQNSTKANGPITFQPAGIVDCEGDNVTSGTFIYPGGVMKNCIRNADSAVNITLSTEDGPGVVKLPAIMPLPKHVAVQITTTTASKTNSNQNPVAEANSPGPSWTRIGGGCSVSYAGSGSQHALVMVKSKPTEGGWECMGADPPGIPVPGWSRAVGTYMRIASARGSVKLECVSLDQSSSLERNPKATVKLTERHQDSAYVLVSGGCSSAYAGAGAPHATPIVQSFPTGDMAGWVCQAADPPGIPMDTTVTAHAVACRITDTDPSSQAIVPKLVSKQFTSATTTRSYPLALVKVDSGWSIPGEDATSDLPAMGQHMRSL